MEESRTFKLMADAKSIYFSEDTYRADGQYGTKVR